MFVDIHNNLRKKCMSNMKRRYTAAAAMMMVMGLCASASAAFDENLNDYTLDTMVVEADAIKNKFGDTITEQSYYRTGGDVKVITREEIEKRHYVDMTEAIKRIPGITFKNPGYRGGEYGAGQYNNTIAINGDDRVIILVDGRRVDNSASQRFGSDSSGKSKSVGVDINQVVNMEAVDKIEVIKGPGASVYGADATGGVINIITRKGSQTNRGTIDIATGSWKKHVYNLSYSGSAGDDNSWHYFVSATRQMSGDSKYHDNLTGKDYDYVGTRYKEENVNVRVDKDFNEKQNLRIWYNHQNGKDGYPISTRDNRYWTQEGWDATIDRYYNQNLAGATNNPGYRNWFALDALGGAYNANNNNDIDISYTFDKDNGMESFIRVYQQKHTYWGGRDYSIPFEGGEGFPGNPNFNEWLSTHKQDSTGVTRYHKEKNRGVELQYGKSVGVNDLLMSVTYDKSNYDKKSLSRSTKLWETGTTERSSVLGYIQDKIHINDKWDVTPALRYSHYSSFTSNVKDRKGSLVKYNDKGDSTTITPTINTQYAFDDTMSAYLGWTKVYRPIKPDSLTVETPNGGKLKDEEGNVWTLGLRKDLDDKTSIAVHYDFTDMSNAVTGYSVRRKGETDFTSKSVNAKETKKSFNLTVDHNFDENWSLGLAYTYLKDEWKAKDGMEFDPEINVEEGNVNALINSLRPKNHYIANLSFEKGRWYSGLLANWYTGMNTTAFTTNRALILDWNVNYEVNKDLTAYVSVNNLTNQGYETYFNNWSGVGSFGMSGRAIMVGMKYSF